MPFWPHLGFLAGAEGSQEGKVGPWAECEKAEEKTKEPAILLLCRTEKKQQGDLPKDEQENLQGSRDEKNAP